MHVIVTGAAGFIGSTLCDALLRLRHTVAGIDSFTDYYSADKKRDNIAPARDAPDFALHELDLIHEPDGRLTEVLRGADIVFHLAGQPGVRGSWASWQSYSLSNVGVTHRLLELATECGVPRVVLASSSSVYGVGDRPMVETAVPRPLSPYAVSKLAAEELCRAYSHERGVSTVCLRYFTVYGPRQRPDMFISKLLRSIAAHETVALYGDGEQRRDVTHVDDVVRATIAAGECDLPTQCTINVGTGECHSVREIIRAAEEVMGQPARLEPVPPPPGEARRTQAATGVAAQLLKWCPSTRLSEGLQTQAAWQFPVCA